MQEHLTAEIDGDASNTSMNYISQLQQPILQHILSFLSQEDAVRTCVLSKAWRQIWCTRPNIDFDESHFKGLRGKTETFQSVVDKTLQGYLDQNLSIEEFCLFDMRVRDSESVSLLDRWIPVVILNLSVERFYLLLDLDNRTPYDLPSVVFQSESLRELGLHRCKLSYSDSNVLCKNLTTLQLECVDIEEETFHNIISSCPLIEYMSLSYCEGLGTIRMNEKLHNLKEFYFTRFREGEDVEIHLPTTLESIHICGNANWRFHYDIKFTNLKYLDLREVQLSSKWSNYFSCNFPVLENLALLNCHGFEEFQLLSHSIKHLTISSWDESPIKAASIDAPNIVSFAFSGDLPQSISFATTFTRWKSKMQLRLHVALTDDDDDVFLVDKWFLKLKDLLQSLRQSEISLFISLKGPSDLVLLDYSGCGDSYKPAAVKWLSLRCCSSPSPFAASFLNGLFRICRPRFIGYSSWFVDARVESLRQLNEFPEFLCNILPLYEDVEEVSIEVKNGKEWCAVNGTIVSECAFPNNENIQYICFRLKWREL